MTTFIDTDALIALVIEADALHAKAVTLHQQLAEKGARILFLSSTLGEFVSVCTNKIGVERTQQAVQTFMKTYTILHIDNGILERSLALYYAQTSKENSLFDCYVMAASEQHAVDCIFSFDRGYRQNNFPTIEDVVKI